MKEIDIEKLETYSVSEVYQFVKDSDLETRANSMIGIIKYLTTKFSDKEDVFQKFLFFQTLLEDEDIREESMVDYQLSLFNEIIEDSLKLLRERRDKHGETST